MSFQTKDPCDNLVRLELAMEEAQLVVQALVNKACQCATSSPALFERYQALASRIAKQVKVNHD